MSGHSPEEPCGLPGQCPDLYYESNNIAHCCTCPYFRCAVYRGASFPGQASFHRLISRQVARKQAFRRQFIPQVQQERGIPLPECPWKCVCRLGGKKPSGRPRKSRPTPVIACSRRLRGRPPFHHRSGRRAPLRGRRRGILTVCDLKKNLPGCPYSAPAVRAFSQWLRFPRPAPNSAGSRHPSASAPC